MFSMLSKNPRTADLRGYTFGRLQIIQFAGYREYKEGNHTRNRPMWTCRCECGKLKDILAASLMRGSTLSCGCMLKEVAAAKGRASALPKGVAASNKLFATYKFQAARRKLPFELDREQFMAIVTQNCHYCGIAPYQLSGDLTMNGRSLYNGIDRIRNEEGYTLQNSVPCCFVCNREKNTLTTKEFLDWANRLSRHLVFGA